MTVSTTSGSAADAATPLNGATPKRPFTFGVAWLAALLIVGMLLGAGGALFATRNVHPGDDSAEAGFLRDMSTHHAQAVEMSMIAHANSANPQIISLSADIALTQHGQIGYMQAWLRDWSLNPTGSRPAMSWMPGSEGSVVNGLMPGMATPEQTARLRTATGKDLDVQFLTLMRQHHLGGIHMAQAIVEQSDDKDVSWLAGTMVSSQQGEINLIDSLLAEVRGS
jgi:uncharacterized protein (DUF305 family)